MIGWILLGVVLLLLAGMGRWLYHQGYAHGWNDYRLTMEAQATAFLEPRSRRERRR